MPTPNQSPPDPPTENLWTKGHLVFARDGAVFPPRCIACNSPDDLTWRKRTLTWAPPSLNYLLFLGLIPGLIILFLFQRKTKIHFAACARCRRRLLIHQLIAASLILAFLACLLLSFTWQNPYLALVGLAFILVAALYIPYASRPFTVLRIQDHTATLRGLGTPFILSLTRPLP